MMTALLVALVVVLTWGWLQERRRVGALEAELEVRTQALEAARITSDSSRAVADGLTVRTRSAGGRLETAREDLGARTDSARRILSDTTASLRETRIQLAATISSVERMDAALLTYQGTVDSLITAHLVTRQAWDGEREAAQAVIETQREALEEGRCAILFAPCPTRRASFLVGVVVAVAVVVLL
jgi:predicted transcriptional regulator